MKISIQWQGKAYIDDSFQSDLDIEPFLRFFHTVRGTFSNIPYDVKNVLIFHRSVSAGVSAWDPGLVTPSQWRSPPADPQAPSPQVPHLPGTMDTLTIKTPNPKCRLCWCLIEFIDWRHSQSCWYFRSALRTIAPLTSLWLASSRPPLPCTWISKLYTGSLYCVCKRGGSMGSKEKRGA